MQTKQFETVTVHPSEVKKGDRCGNEKSYWIATSDAIEGDTHILVNVRHQPDGGLDARVWVKDIDKLLDVQRPLPEVTTETFTLHIDVKGKENIERFSDALQEGGPANLLIEIESLVGTKIQPDGDNMEVSVMENHPFGMPSYNPFLENITVRED